MRFLGDINRHKNYCASLCTVLHCSDSDIIGKSFEEQFVKTKNCKKIPSYH